MGQAGWRFLMSGPCQVLAVLLSLFSFVVDWAMA